jgi:hypothetical protein
MRSLGLSARGATPRGVNPSLEVGCREAGTGFWRCALDDVAIQSLF